MRARLVSLAVLLMGMVWLAGCPQGATVAEIKADPNRFAGKSVSITGNVTTSFGVLGQGAYEIDDGTGKIWVLTESGGVPGQGARVRVTGRVHTGVTFAGRTFGTVIRESSHKTESVRPGA